MKLAAFCNGLHARWVILGLLILSLVTTAACQSTQYLWQAALGQWHIVAASKPITELLQDTSTPEQLVSRLSFIKSARDYAERRLGLPVGDAYHDYADLERPFVVWNLVVAPELSFDNKTWCYPVAGCVTYQGYFQQADAQAAAQHWQQHGFDTHVGGVTAYSTLGWFDDPVLNTFIHYDLVSLAALLFHELAHRRLYVEDDTTFNESWATAVEQEAVEQFVADRLSATNKVRDDHSAQQASQHILIKRDEVARYQKRFAERKVFVELVENTVNQLKQVYLGNSDDEHKRKTKAELLNQLRSQYFQAVDQQRLSLGYRNWFADGLNNARLSTVTSYHQWVPGLRWQIQQLQHEWKVFYQWSEVLAELDKADRDQALQQLNRQAKLLQTKN